MSDLKDTKERDGEKVRVGGKMKGTREK